MAKIFHFFLPTGGDIPPTVEAPLIVNFFAPSGFYWKCCKRLAHLDNVEYSTSMYWSDFFFLTKTSNFVYKTLVIMLYTIAVYVSIMIYPCYNIYIMVDEKTIIIPSSSLILWCMMGLVRSSCTKKPIDMRILCSLLVYILLIIICNKKTSKYAHKCITFFTGFIINWYSYCYLLILSVEYFKFLSEVGLNRYNSDKNT